MIRADDLGSHAGRKSRARRVRAAFARTDPLAAYRAVAPEGRHAAGNGAGRAGRVGRFWNTLGQRAARLARKLLPLTTCARDRVGALWHRIRLHNRTRRCRP